MTPLFVLLLFSIAFVDGQKCVEYPEFPSGSFNVTIIVDNQDRTFQLFTPWNEFSCGKNSYCTGPPKEPRPLVFNWHGCNAHVPVVSKSFV